MQGFHKPFPRNILQIPKNPVVLWFVLFVSESHNSVGLLSRGFFGVIAAFPQQKFLVCYTPPMPPDSLFGVLWSHKTRTTFAHNRRSRPDPITDTPDAENASGDVWRG